ncbi:MAG TPA: GAF domain-containing SpoIIE family protein phosphatase [Anaerolineae bacterium]|nr:GAF domain-containing SpoIIE family protein phosphatase [Anaerolineae bacterium]
MNRPSEKANVTQPSGERLALLYRVSQTFNSSLDLDEVLNRVIDEVIAATRAERGFVMLRDESGRLTFRAARGMDQRTIDAPAFQISRTVIERVARESRPLLTHNAQNDEWLRERTSVIALGLRSVLCVPLMLKGESIGVVYVDNRLQTGLFTSGDLELLTAIASSASVAIDNARLYQVAVEKGRLEHELQVAREVQVSLLPRETPRVPGWEFAAHWQPAREVSGDFYDFIESGPDRLGIVIADVSDKGMPAALFMALTRSILRASAAAAESPAQCITQANRLICADATNGMFVTLCYAQLNSAAGELTYVNAGHNPPLRYRAQDDQLIELERTGAILGFDEALPFEQRTFPVAAGDFIFLYTDGVTEALDAQQREFGKERLRQLLWAQRRASAEVIVAALEQAIGSFTGSTAPFDDITFAIAKCL